MMTTKTDELLAEFDAGNDEEEFYRLERSSPWLAGIIARLVKAGLTPEFISGRLKKNQPHNWILAQQVKAAARYVWRAQQE